MPFETDTSHVNPVEAEICRQEEADLHAKLTSDEVSDKPLTIQELANLFNQEWLFTRPQRYIKIEFD